MPYNVLLHGDVRAAAGAPSPPSPALYRGLYLPSTSPYLGPYLSRRCAEPYPPLLI